METVPSVKLIFINCLLLWAHSSQAQPLLQAASGPEDTENVPRNSKRFHRSIPDWDAVNPSYMDSESQRNYQGLHQPAQYNHVRNLFHQPNNTKELQDTDSAGVNFDEVVQGAVLPADEQEECYRQQNIDPPPTIQRDRGLNSVSNSHYNKRNQWRPLVEAETPHKLTASEDVRSLEREQYEKYQLHETDPVEQKEFNYKINIPLRSFREKSRQYINGLPRDKLESRMTRRVYKPTKTIDQFPIYDEDIEFQPDPLQGILDDKYWENQQYKGNIIRNYIDLAANNMVYGSDIVKRESESSKSGLNDNDGRCPCKQVVSCKDCKKGKDEGIPQLNNRTISAKSNQNRKKRSSHFSEGEAVIHDNSKENSYITNNFLSRKLLSWEDEYEEESDDRELGSHSFTYGNANGNHNPSSKRNYEVKGQFHDEYSNKKQKHMSPHDRSPSESWSVTNRMYDTKHSFSLSNQGSNEHFNISQNPFFEVHTRNPGLYVPNKLANMMQKVRQEKPKGPQKTKKPEINPNQEFNVMENQIFNNYTLNLTALSINKTKRKQDNEIYHNFSKGRRSPEEFKSGLKPLLATLDNSKAVNLNSSFTNHSFTTPGNKSTVFLNTYQSTPNLTSTTAFMYHTSKKHLNNKLKDNDVDAEIANDIVETVLIGSQKNTLLGHNLGLFRRNETLKNVKYGRVVPETEEIVGVMVNCIMEKMKAHLAKQSCILLDAELLDFLKWLVLSGESYKDYSGETLKEFTTSNLGQATTERGIDAETSSECPMDYIWGNNRNFE